MAGGKNSFQIACFDYFFYFLPDIFIFYFNYFNKIKKVVCVINLTAFKIFFSSSLSSGVIKTVGTVPKFIYLLQLLSTPDLSLKRNIIILFFSAPWPEKKKDPDYLI